MLALLRVKWAERENINRTHLVLASSSLVLQKSNLTVSILHGFLERQPLGSHRPLLPELRFYGLQRHGRGRRRPEPDRRTSARHRLHRDPGDAVAPVQRPLALGVVVQFRFRFHRRWCLELVMKDKIFHGSITGSILDPGFETHPATR